MATVGNVVFQISADLKNVQGQLRTMENNFQSSFTKIQNIAKSAGGQLAGALGLGLSIGSLVAFGNKVVEIGDQLSDLSDQTGISIAILGGIKPVLDSSNSSLDGFAKGINKAQAQLGDLKGGGKEAAEALQAIGLNARELAQVSPDQFLEKLVNALATVENRNERLAISKRILGKAAAELIPTINQLAETGIAKLDDATADAYKSLGQFKDQLVQIGAVFTNLAAGPLAGFIEKLSVILKLLQLMPKTASENTEALKSTVQNLTEKSAAALGRPAGAIALMSDDELKALGASSRSASASGALAGLLEARKQLNELIAKTPFKPPASGGGAGAFKDLLPGKAETAGVDKLAQALESYRQTLIKTITEHEVEIIKLKLGDEAALAAAQAYEALGFKAKLAADKLEIPPEVEESARNATETLRAMGADVATLGEKSLIKLQEGALQAADSINILKASLEDGLKVVQAFADAANEGVGIQAQATTPQQAASRRSAEDQFNDLRTQLQIDSIDTSTPAGAESKRVAQIQADFAKTAQKIEELARQAQLSNEESAELTALAWKKSLQEIENKTDEVTEFQRRAMERAFDAGADLLKDVLGGQIKTWQDFGMRVKKVIDEIAADWLTLQAKKLILGPDFGKSGGQVGGLLGNIADLFKSGPASLPTGYGSRPAGMEGPSLPNGGFFSNPIGSIAGGFGSLLKVFGFHEGGMAGPGGASFTRDVPAAYYYSAPRYHQGIDFAGGEMPAILKRGEEVGWPKDLAEKYGRSGGGVTIHLHSPKFTDRRSAQQESARLGAAVKQANRNL